MRRSRKNNDVTVREADGEKLREHCTQTDEEAGSIVFHVGHDMNEKELTDWQCEWSRLLRRRDHDGIQARRSKWSSSSKKTKEDVETSRLIEERRSTSKGEKQRLKDLSKKNASGTRKEQKDKRWFNEYSKTSKGIRNIPGITSARRRVLITKIKNEKGEVVTSRKGIANVFGEFHKKLYDDQEHEETEQEHEENETESSIDVQNKDTSEMKRIPEITNEELQTAINRLKKMHICRQQWNQSRGHQSLRWRDERNGKTDLQRNRKAKWIHSRGMAKSENKSDFPKGRRGRCWKLPPDLFLCLRCASCSRQYCTADYIPDFTKSKRKIRLSSEALTKQHTIFRHTGWLIKDATSGESKCVLQQSTSWRPSSPSPTHQFGTPSNPAVSNMITSTSWKIVHRPESHSTDRRRKWHVRGKERNQTGWPSVQHAIRHDSTESIGRRHSTLAKEKRNVYLLGWQRSWLPHKHEICWRCALVCIFKRTAPKNVIWLSSVVQKSGTHNTSRKDENPQQPKLEHQKRNGDWRHRSREINKRRKYEIFGPDDIFPAGRRRPKSEIASGPPGQHSTSADKNWHRKLTCLDIDFGSSTLWYPRRWTAPLESGPSQKEHERMIQSTQHKMLRLIIQTERRYKKIEKRKDKTNENDDTEDLGSTEDENEDGQSSNTCYDQDLSGTILTRRLTQQRLKKKNGLSTQKEPQTKPSKRWRMRRFDVGSRLTKEWNGGWRRESHLCRMKYG